MNRAEQHQDYDCYICLEPITLLVNGHTFGLLEHCAHVFCFECITTWRQQSGLDHCPICCSPSPMVMPWLSFPSLDERASLFAMHRTNEARLQSFEQSIDLLRERLSDLRLSEEQARVREAKKVKRPWKCLVYVMILLFISFLIEILLIVFGCN